VCELVSAHARWVAAESRFLTVVAVRKIDSLESDHNDPTLQL
jgi:hypothetical protein